MNYYNPQFFSMPTNFTVPKVGIFNRLFGNFKISSIINGTQRVLNFTNQLIPVVKQVQPMVKNAKTMFKVMNEFKKNDITHNNDNINYDKNNNSNIINHNSTSNTNIENNQENKNQGPTFFM